MLYKLKKLAYKLSKMAYKLDKNAFKSTFILFISILQVTNDIQFNIFNKMP